MRSSAAPLAPASSAARPANAAIAAATVSAVRTQCRDVVLLRRHARLDLRQLHRRLLHLPYKLLPACLQLFAALPVEHDAIFSAIEFQRRLTDQILVVLQFGIELVDARVKPLLLGLQLQHRLRLLRLARSDFTQQPRQPVGFHIQPARFAGQQLPQQAAHLHRATRRSAAP